MNRLVNQCVNFGVHHAADAVEQCVAHHHHAGHGDLIWRGECCHNPKSVFNNLNFEGAERHSGGKGNVKAIKDEDGQQCWRVFKPDCDKRAEIRGAEGYHQKEGETYYIGWRWRIHMAHEKNDGVTIFQWKSYGDFSQNYPFAMGFDGHHLSLTKFDPDWQKDRKHRITKIWEAPHKIGQWTNIIIGLKLSRKKEHGWIEIYHNGQLQELKTGGTRVKHKTMDGSETAPKWGMYNRHCIGKEMSVDLQNMCIGKTVESVKEEMGIQ